MTVFIVVVTCVRCMRRCDPLKWLQVKCIKKFTSFDNKSIMSSHEGYTSYVGYAEHQKMSGQLSNYVKMRWADAQPHSACVYVLSNPDQSVNAS